MNRLTRKLAALLLAFALLLPNPAWALREEQTETESGLEEIKLALLDQQDPVRSTALVLKDRLADALGLSAPVTPPVLSAAGLEESLDEQIAQARVELGAAQMVLDNAKKAGASVEVLSPLEVQHISADGKLKELLSRWKTQERQAATATGLEEDWREKLGLLSNMALTINGYLRRYYQRATASFARGPAENFNPFIFSDTLLQILDEGLRYIRSSTSDSRQAEAAQAFFLQVQADYFYVLTGEKVTPTEIRTRLKESRSDLQWNFEQISKHIAVAGVLERFGSQSLPLTGADFKFVSTYALFEYGLGKPQEAARSTKTTDVMVALMEDALGGIVRRAAEVIRYPFEISAAGGLEEDTPPAEFQAELAKPEVTGGQGIRGRTLTGPGHTYDALVLDHFPSELVPVLAEGLSPLVADLNAKGRFTWVDTAGGLGAALKEGSLSFNNLSPLLVDAVRWTPDQFHPDTLAKLEASAASAGVSLWSDEIPLIQANAQTVELRSHARAPIRLVTMMNALGYNSDPLRIIENSFNQLDSGGLLLTNLYIPTGHAKSEELAQFYARLRDHLRTQGIEADFKITDWRKENRITAELEQAPFPEYSIGIVLKKGPNQRLKVISQPQSESFAIQTVRTVTYQVAWYGKDPAQVIQVVAVDTQSGYQVPHGPLAPVSIGPLGAQPTKPSLPSLFDSAELREKGFVALSPEQISALGYDPKMTGFLVSDSANVTDAGHFVIAESGLANEAAANLFAWIYAGEGLNDVVDYAKSAEAQDGDLMLVQPAEGISAESVAVLLRKRGFSENHAPRVVIGNKGQVSTLSPMVFQLLATQKGLPPVVFLNVGMKLTDEARNSYTLLLMT